MTKRVKNNNRYPIAFACKINEGLTAKEFRELIAAQPRKRNKPEAKFQRAAEDYLRLKKFAVIRINSGAFHSDDGKRFIKCYNIPGLGDEGLSDLIALKKGINILIETKSKSGVLSASQKKAKSFFEALGVPYFKVNNLDQLIVIVERFENGI